MSTAIEWARNTDGTQDETWHLVPDFLAYEVSDHGQVRSWKGKVPKLLRQIPRKSGHLYLFLYRNNRSHKRYVHRLVLEAFRGPAGPDEECRHLDGNPANNRLDNLAWGTAQQNTDDKRRHGTIPEGEQVRAHKLTEEQVREIRARYPAESSRVLARKYNVAHVTIQKAANGSRWRSVQEERASYG